MILRIILIATAATAIGGCSSHRHSTTHSESTGNRVLRTKSCDSIMQILSATIDSPEIVIESPTMPGGRATIRGPRLKATTQTTTVSDTDVIETEELNTATTTDTTEDRRSIHPHRVLIVLCTTIAVIFFIIGRKTRKKS